MLGATTNEKVAKIANVTFKEVCISPLISGQHRGHLAYVISLTWTKLSRYIKRYIYIYIYDTLINFIKSSPSPSSTMISAHHVFSNCKRRVTVISFLTEQRFMETDNRTWRNRGLWCTLSPVVICVFDLLLEAKKSSYSDKKKLW